MISFSIILLASANPAALEDPWLKFVRSPAFERRITSVEVGTLFRQGGDWQYWAKRTVRSGEQVELHFADTERCPALRSVVLEARNMPAPQISVPGDPSMEEFVITADGIGYSVESGARYGKNIGSDIRFTSNVGTPLAAWVESSLEALDNCWSVDAPPAR